jgi:hypothetical protein
MPAIYLCVTKAPLALGTGGASFRFGRVRAKRGNARSIVLYA